MIKKTISIVIPCFNEENNIEKTFIDLKKVFNKYHNYNFEYIFVDDGSIDNTFQKIKSFSLNDKSVKCVKLSRNFGSHISITAGFEHAIYSDAAILITADLQEPPEIITKLIESWEKGIEIVWTVRKYRNQKFINKLFSKIFYSLFVKYSILKNYPKEGSSAFWLLDKKIISNLKKFKESNRMLNGLISWMGYKQDIIYYNQRKRKHGISSFNIFSLIKLAIDSFVSFSSFPIRLITYIGLALSLFSFLYSIILILEKFLYGIDVPGYTSLMVIVLILGGVQLLTLGILGEYIWRGVDESRKRPLYLVSELLNFDKDEDQKNL